MDPPCSASSTPTASAAPRWHRQWTSNFAILTLHAFGLAKAGCPESGHGRFRGGGGLRNGPAHSWHLAARPTLLDQPAVAAGILPLVMGHPGMREGATVGIRTTPAPIDEPVGTVTSDGPC